MSVAHPSDIFQPGDLLNNTYRIEEILGKGGTSEVFKARSEVSGKIVAVKALRAEYSTNDDFLVLMTREEDIRDVRHDAVVRYFDTQRMPDGVVYLVMDHVDGPGLDRKLEDGGMPAAELMAVGKRVCEGLIAAHERNIVHRDLSPDNIILRNDMPSEAVIIDFGIAKDTNPGAQTIVGNEFAGKYAYAAPEQLSGQTDHRSDLYSLGALLLSTFRGKPPDIGKNPMEVVQKKGEPLDVSGVPDPLGKLLAKMCAPDPNERFQTARELLAAFENPDSIDVVPSAGSDALDDATVIVPLAQKDANVAAEAPAKKAVGVPSEPKAAKQSDTKKRGPLVPILGAIAVAALGGAGAYFGGLFGASYPEADPFALSVERSVDGSLTAEGFAPSPEVSAALTDIVSQAGGTASFDLASGDIMDTWGDEVGSLVDTALTLDEFRVSVSNDLMNVTGLTTSRTVRDAAVAGFADSAFAGAATIELGPRFLTERDVRAKLIEHADCGPLFLPNLPAIGYGLEDQVIVIGRFAEESTKTALQSGLREISGDRVIRVEGEVLNDSLCKIDTVLPNVGPGGFLPRFGFGDRPGTNLAGTYKVGDNPTIDVKLPETIQDGFLWVSVIDVRGVVFHLLPNRTRPENSVRALRSEAEDGFVRVAYGLSEAAGRLAFNVDGSVLGKSKVVVLHSDQALFDELRPTTESAASYAEALQAARSSGALKIDSLDSAILTTEN